MKFNLKSDALKSDIALMKAKSAAANRACDFVEEAMVSNIIVGLGSGSTAEIFVSLLAARKLSLRCVASSERIAALAQKQGLELVDSAAFMKIDVLVDGADEIDRDLNMIKGLGGALLREKIVAEAAGEARQRIIIADATKLVAVLGANTPVPVEVFGFGREAARYRLADLVGDLDEVRLRTIDGKPYQTDGENYIYDCFFGRMAQPRDIAAELNSLPFVAAHGLFLDMADVVVIGYDDETTEIKNKKRPSDGA